MCTYLDNERANYAFRRAVPKHLQSQIRTASGKPRTEWRYSLKTKDRAEANRLCHLEAVKTDLLLKAAEAALAALRMDSAKTPDERRREREQWEADRVGDALREQEAVALDFEFEARHSARQAVLNNLANPEQLTPDLAAVRDLIDEAEFDNQTAKDRRADQLKADWQAAAAEVAANFRTGQSDKPETKAYPRLLDIFDAYSLEAEHEPATVKAWKPMVRHLIEHLGHDDASRITTPDIRAWKDALVSEKDDKGQPERGAKTIREGYLAAVKATLNWGLENGLIPSNPAAPVKIRVPRKVELRAPQFTDDEVAIILSGTLKPQGDSISPEHALARRWVPWICAYTGARVNEITQLRAQDVREIKGHWTILITPAAGRQKSKKARIVPLHSHLVEQGFPAVASAKGEGPLFYNPTRARSGNTSSLSTKMGERLASWVRTLGVDDPNVQPNHAWRHLFKTLARDHGLDADAREAIPGHAHGTEGRKYGSTEVPFLAGEIEKLPRFSSVAPSRDKAP